MIKITLRGIISGLVAAFILGTLSAAPAPRSETALAKVISTSRDAVVLGFDLGQIESKQVAKAGVTYEAYTIPEEGTTYEYGRPLLPAVSRFVVVPPDAGVELDVRADAPRRLRAVQPPAICDDSLLAGNGVQPLQFLYPGKVAEMSEPFVIRGARLVKVTVFPVQYDPATGSYLQYNNIETSLRFTDDEPINPVEFPVRRYRSRNFLNMIQALAINGDEVGRDDPSDSEPPYVGHYLVAAHEATIPWIRDWIEFRRKTGYKMDIYSVAANDAANSPDNVKRRIQERYDAYVQQGIDPFDQLVLVGDHAYDVQVTNGSQNRLVAFAGWSIWGQNGYPHADFLFACLEGGNNDIHPDVGYSRLPAGSQGGAGLVMGRTMAYEATPRMENPGWFTRGGVYSQHWGNGEGTAWHVTIATNVRWGEEVLQSLGFNDIMFYENWNYDQGGNAIGPRMVEAYNNGSNVLIGRAEIYYWGRGNFQGVNNNTVFPIDICYSGHGEWTLQVAYLSGDANNLKGPVARTCGWGWPATAPMSYVWLYMVNGVLQRDLPLGWARVLSVSAIEGIMPDFQVYGGVGLYRHIKTDTDCFGDPGIQPWIGVPRLAAMTLPQTVTPDTRSLEVFVHRPNSEEPMPGARVTFYAPGRMPQGAPDYVAYTSFIMKTTTADSNGIARFALEDGEALVNATPLFVSVSGRDIRPNIVRIDIAIPPSALELGDWTLTQQEGNGDDAINPGETFTLDLTVSNIGNRNTLQGVMGSIESVSPYLEVVENETVAFGDIAAGAEAQADAGVTIRFSPATPDATSRPITRPQLTVDLSSDGNHWESVIQFDPVAPHYQLRAIIPGAVIQTRAGNLDLDLNNVGSRGGTVMTARLISRGMGVTVIRETATYGAIAAGGHARVQGDQFSVSGNQLAVPGSKSPLILVLSDDAGFRDTVSFELQIGTARANAPQGPDKFGYICFDDTDTDWDMAPSYDWLEINPNANDAEFEGTLLNFQGQSPDNIGEALAVNLGFTTQFYGERFNQITVATNGFVAMGNQPRITNFQNWPMDNAFGGGVGMLAPLWDELRFGQGTGVYVYRDDDEHCFVVEWYRMRNAAGNVEFTFQVVIYDAQFWVTESGNQNILFQYKTASANNNIRAGDAEWSNNIPYASVGISSPSGKTGISYCFNNQLPVTSVALANRRALLFSTSPVFRSGLLKGRVTDAATGEGIEGATVFTNHGFAAYTDAEGYFRINGALAELEFSFTARKQGYNDSTVDSLVLPENDSLVVNFELLHPEFVPNVQRLDASLAADEAAELPFRVTNSGNGPLNWRVTRRLIGDADADPWQVRRRYDVTQVTGDDHIEGAVFVGDRFYLSGANGNDSNMIWVLDREGGLVDNYQQLGHARYGYKDLEFDGELIWGSGEDTVYAFTPDGELVHKWRGPHNPTSYIAWDSDRNVLWLSGTTTDIIACDVEGHAVGQRILRRGLRIYGLSYWPEDPDGCPLYILDQPSQSPPMMHKMNPAVGDSVLVRAMELPQGATGLIGSSVTNQFDVYSWVLLTLANIPPDEGGDQLVIYQLDARRDWFTLNVEQGLLDAGQTQNLVLTLDAVGLPAVQFEAELYFTHNADDGSAIIPISLEVLVAAGDEDRRRIPLAQGWNTVSLNVEPRVEGVPELLQPLVVAGLLRLVKDGSGRFYRPDNDFNNIPRWDPADGYLMYLSGDGVFDTRGIVIPADRPIPLSVGWNLKSYYPRQPTDPAVAVQRIAGSLSAVKDGSGRFYLPAYDYSNMDPMQEGHGYYFRATEAVDLIYTVGDGRLAAEVNRVEPPTHFRLDRALNGDNLSLLLLGSPDQAGVEVGVFTAFGVCGIGRFDESGRCGVAVWGDDPMTDNRDGALTGEKLCFRTYDGSRERQVAADVIEGEFLWAEGELTIGRLIEAAPIAFGLEEAYPNPFNSAVRIHFGVAAAGLVKLAIYDIAGRRAATLTEGVVTAGRHEAVWQADGFATGLYVARLEQAGRSDARKLLLVK